jgi:hypothetical protein
MSSAHGDYIAGDVVPVWFWGDQATLIAT